MQNILFLGGAGFIGSNLVRYFLNDNNYKVFVFEPTFAHLDRLSDLRDKITIIRGSIADFDLVKCVIEDHRIDIIVHLARLRDKSRKVVQIAEVGDCINGEIVLTPLFKFVENSQDKHGKVIGTLVRQNNVFNRTEKLKAAGFSEW